MAQHPARVDNCIVQFGDGRPSPFFVRVKLPGGQEATGAFATITQARAFRDKVKTQRHEGTALDQRTTGITFRRYAEDWQRSRSNVMRLGTNDRVRTALTKHAYPVIGDRKLSAVRKSHVQDLVNTMAASMAPTTVSTVYAIISAVFTTAVDDRLLGVSPCQRIKLPREEASTDLVPLSAECVAAVAANIRPELRGAVFFGAGSGLRPGELFGLTLDRVKFLRREVHVDRQLLTAQRGGVYLGPLKSKASYGDVPLAATTIDLLNEHIRKFPPVECTVPVGPPPPAGTEDTRPRVTAKFLFAPDGSVVRRARQAFLWREAVNGLVLPDRSGWHGLRHFYASSLLDAGASIKIVQARLRKASAADTLRTYAHLMKDSDEVTRRAIDAAMGAITAGTDRIAQAR